MKLYCNTQVFHFQSFQHSMYYSVTCNIILEEIKHNLLYTQLPIRSQIKLKHYLNDSK